MLILVTCYHAFSILIGINKFFFFFFATIFENILSSQRELASGIQVMLHISLIYTTSQIKSKLEVCTLVDMTEC